MIQNYAILGEYMAYSKQAKDAADKRFALLYNLANQAGQLSQAPEKPLNADDFSHTIEQAAAADREMQAAIARANQAAALCGEREINLRSLGRNSHA